MKTREPNRGMERGVLAELQNVGADSKGLSPFLAFWRSATTPFSGSPGNKTKQIAGSMAVDVSPRRTKRRCGTRGHP